MDATLGPDTDDGGTGLAAGGGVPVASTDLTDDVELAWDRFVPERDEDPADDFVGGLQDLEVEDPDTVAEDLELRWDVFESDARDAEDDEKSARFEAVLERMTQRAQRHAEGGVLESGVLEDGVLEDGRLEDSRDMDDVEGGHTDDASVELFLIDDEDVLGDPQEGDTETRSFEDEQIDASLARLHALMDGDGDENRAAAAFDDPYDWFGDEDEQLHAGAGDADAELDDALLHEAATGPSEPEAIHMEFEESESWFGDDDAEAGTRADDATAPAPSGPTAGDHLAERWGVAPAAMASESTWDDSWEVSSPDSWGNTLDDSWENSRDERDDDAWPEHEVEIEPGALAAASTDGVLEAGAPDETEASSPGWLDGPALDDPAHDVSPALDDPVLDGAALAGGTDAPTRSHRRRRAAADSDQRRLVMLALLFFLVVLAAMVLHFGRTPSGGSSPTTPAASSSSSPAQLARLESAIADVQSASSGAQAELTTLTLFPTPPRVATVVNPYGDALHLYDTLATTVTVPARAQVAAQATQAQVRSDMAFLRTVNGLPPIQLGAFITSFLARSTQLQETMDTLQHALDPSGT